MCYLLMHVRHPWSPEECYSHLLCSDFITLTLYLLERKPNRSQHQPLLISHVGEELGAPTNYLYAFSKSHRRLSGVEPRTLEPLDAS